jgi:hypothetical protein
MTKREALLKGALVANAALRVQAEHLIAAYVAPESDREAIISELITLFDGPQQREAERLTAVTLGVSRLLKEPKAAAPARRQSRLQTRSAITPDRSRRRLIERL